jgi:hypothetical protein
MENLKLEFDDLLRNIEIKAREENTIPEEDEVEGLRFDLKDRNCRRRVCITIGGQEFCYCLD